MTKPNLKFINFNNSLFASHEIVLLKKVTIKSSTTVSIKWLSDEFEDRRITYLRFHLLTLLKKNPFSFISFLHKRLVFFLYFSYFLKIKSIIRKCVRLYFFFF